MFSPEVFLANAAIESNGSVSYKIHGADVDKGVISAKLRDTLVNHADTVEVTSGGVAIATGLQTGVLQVDAGGVIDGAVIASGATLTLSSGGKTERLTLPGVYATSNFALSTDGAGGTLVSWVASGGYSAPFVAGVPAMAAAMAAFSRPGADDPRLLAATSAAHAPILAGWGI